MQNDDDSVESYAYPSAQERNTDGNQIDDGSEKNSPGGRTHYALINIFINQPVASSRIKPVEI